MDEITLPLIVMVVLNRFLEVAVLDAGLECLAMEILWLRCGLLKATMGTRPNLLEERRLLHLR